MLNYYNNIGNLVVCQKSKVQDWVNHFKEYYPNYDVFDLTNKKKDKQTKLTEFELWSSVHCTLKKWVAVINYDLLIRRPNIQNLKFFTLLLDESSEIKNERTKRGKFILKMKPKNVILLTGTPMNGKFEELWSQLKLLNWNISRDLFDRQYLEYKIDTSLGYPRKVRIGYKNKERLLRKLREYGGVFRKTEEVFDLPQKVAQIINIPQSKAYQKYQKNKIIEIDNKLLVGDMRLNNRLNKRLLCGVYSDEKLQAFQDLVNSTNDRIIVFYNFNDELEKLEKIVNKAKSYVNGSIKDLNNYNNEDNSVTFVQYRAGSMGLNLQKANRIIYFSPPDGDSIYFEQSQKRIHRIGQERTCFYYYLMIENSIETDIYETLDIRKEINFELFKKEGR